MFYYQRHFQLYEYLEIAIEISKFWAIECFGFHIDQSKESFSPTN